MTFSLSAFLWQVPIMAASLWLASKVFDGLRFERGSDLLLSALMLGLVNAVIKPALIFLTLPLTLLTLGLFLLVINALMLMLVAVLVRGFSVRGFWTAFFAGILISITSLILQAWVVPDHEAPIPVMPQPSGGGTWI